MDFALLGSITRKEILAGGWVTRHRHIPVIHRDAPAGALESATAGGSAARATAQAGNLRGKSPVIARIQGLTLQIWLLNVSWTGSVDHNRRWKRHQQRRTHNLRLLARS
jgi:hypothetical protein